MMVHPPHVIRLREPWEFSTSTDGRWTLARHFRLPTGLQPQDRVELVAGGLEDVHQAACNGHTLQLEWREAGTWSSNITQLLLARNRVEILLDAAAMPAAAREQALRQHVLAAGLIRLEIHSPE